MDNALGKVCVNYSHKMTQEEYVIYKRNLEVKKIIRNNKYYETKRKYLYKRRKEIMKKLVGIKKFKEESEKNIEDNKKEIAIYDTQLAELEKQFWTIFKKIQIHEGPDIQPSGQEN